MVPRNHIAPFLCVHAKSVLSYSTLGNPMDCSPPGSSVHGTLQARILEWVVMPSSRRSSPPKEQTCVSCGSCVAGGFFTAKPLGKPRSHRNPRPLEGRHWGRPSFCSSGLPGDHLVLWFSTGVALPQGGYWHCLETPWVVITRGGDASGI